MYSALFSGPLLVGAFVATQIVGWTKYYFDEKFITKCKVEEHSARMAMEPMLLAERDR